VTEIRECDEKEVIAHQKVMILVRHKYAYTTLVILDVVVMKVNTRLTCFMELIGSISLPITNFRLACIIAVLYCNGCLP
jgi:hypothetical protein